MYRNDECGPRSPDPQRADPSGSMTQLALGREGSTSARQGRTVGRDGRSAGATVAPPWAFPRTAGAAVRPRTSLLLEPTRVPQLEALTARPTGRGVGGERGDPPPVHVGDPQLRARAAQPVPLPPSPRSSPDEHDDHDARQHRPDPPGQPAARDVPPSEQLRAIKRGRSFPVGRRTRSGAAIVPGVAPGSRTGSVA
jgi:hypothetical protein